METESSNIQELEEQQTNGKEDKDSFKKKQAEQKDQPKRQSLILKKIKGFQATAVKHGSADGTNQMRSSGQGEGPGSDSEWVRICQLPVGPHRKSFH